MCSEDNLQHLSEDELKEAIKLLDLNKSGYIEFPEFVSWWVNEIKVDKDAADAALAEKVKV
jgi:Ca2+-binding EF-hand superfamily protein